MCIYYKIEQPVTIYSFKYLKIRILMYFAIEWKMIWGGVYWICQLSLITISEKFYNKVFTVWILFIVIGSTFIESFSVISTIFVLIYTNVTNFCHNVSLICQMSRILGYSLFELQVWLHHWYIYFFSCYDDRYEFNMQIMYDDWRFGLSWVINNDDKKNS